LLCGDVAGRIGVLTGPDITRWIAANGPIEGLEVEYVASPCLAKIFERLHNLPGLWMLWYGAYNVWQRAAYGRALTLHQQRHFDVVHHLNIIGFREPGYLWQLGVPFFWGPINGADNIPMAYYRQFGGLSSAMRPVLRDIANKLQVRLGRRTRKAARAATKVWTVTEADSRMVTRLWQCKPHPMLETGTTVYPNATPRRKNVSAPLEICWSGNFQPRKALPLLLKGLAQLNRPNQWQLHVLGTGPALAAWQGTAKALNLTQYIKWHGLLTHESAIRLMNQCHVLVHTSLQEGTPHVAMEALSLGLPVICHDACGMGIAVTNQCGIKVPLLDPETSVRGFAAAIQRFLDNPDLVFEYSLGALRHAETVSWDRKAAEIAASYYEAFPVRS
jgi:glycosyltransferase involved in cell wall biosynthesis